MANIKKTLAAIDSNLNKFQPDTMDSLLDIVFASEGAGNYGVSFSIVKYMGYTQGVRVHVTGRKVTHTLPTKNKVYSVFKGLQPYFENGWQVVNE